MRRKLSSVTKKFFALFLVFCTVRTALFFGADEAAGRAALAAAHSEETVSMLLDLGFGTVSPKQETDMTLAALLSQSPALRLPHDEPEAPPESTAPPVTERVPIENKNSDVSEAPPQDDIEAPAEAADTVETTITGENGYDGADGIYLYNETDYEIDIAAMLNEPMTYTVDASKPQVLIIHTHGSEAFDRSDGNYYEETDPWRTEDDKYNVIRLGDELEKTLNERGISVIHDRGLYDYPSYSGSYTRAEAAINEYLEEHPDIKVVIDLHRDALIADDGTVYKTVAEVNGEKCAQVMIVSGSNFSGLEHPEWRENLKLALRLQATMNAKYPTLARPLKISQYRYNQQLTAGSLIIEIGCSGNTLSEALAATGYFADSAADVLLNLSGGTVPAS